MKAKALIVFTVLIALTSNSMVLLAKDSFRDTQSVGECERENCSYCNDRYQVSWERSVCLDSCSYINCRHLKK